MASGTGTVASVWDMWLWIERDRRREAMPLEDREVFVAVYYLRGLTAPSPAWKDPAAELGAEGETDVALGLEDAREAAERRNALE